MPSERKLPDELNGLLIEFEHCTMLATAQPTDFLKKQADAARKSLEDYLRELIRERLQLAMLAAEDPHFTNPLVVWEVQELRDRILAEHYAGSASKGGE